MPRIKKNTIKDVAQKAGVSIATVSFVLNNRPGQVISEPVKKKVMAAARSLNYHPSAIAAGLATRRPGNIAIIFYRSEDLISNQYYSFVLEGAIREAAGHAHNLFFSYMDGDYGQQRDLPKVVKEGNTEGVIFVKEIHPQMVADIEQLGIPVVLVDHYPKMSTVNAIEIDNYRGGQLAVEHLVKLGHSNICMLYAFDERPSIKGRIEGFTNAMKQAGLKCSAQNNLCACDDLSFDAGVERATRLLQRKRPPSAIVCVNDEVAAGVIRAAHRLGLKVPQDLSIVGFDNITMGNYTDPALTTVGGDKEGLGAHAIKRLLEMVEKKEKRIIMEVLPVELVVRESTGPVR